LIHHHQHASPYREFPLAQTPVGLLLPAIDTAPAIAAATALGKMHGEKVGVAAIIAGAPAAVVMQGESAFHLDQEER